MTLKEHKKHSTIKRPGYGSFGRQEWAILGAPCDTIKALADTVIGSLAAAHKCAYVDTRHAKGDAAVNLPGRLAAGAAMAYTDEIHYGQFNYKAQPNPFQYRQLFNEADLVLVNGNHHQAKAQVVVIDAVKKESLRKRVAQLTNVQLFLMAGNADEIFDFVREAVPEWQQVPVLRLADSAEICAFFGERLLQAKPVLNGLVLAGGKSTRMGQDKGAMAWHGKEQRYFAADLLQEQCREVFISCRPEQQAELNGSYKTIPDTFTGLGPYGAILSAFREQPEAAWLVVACDLPMLHSETLRFLVQHRNAAANATTFESPQDGFPEPLITIWEPKSYLTLLAFLAQGYTCPRKVLLNSDISLLQSPDPQALLNVNTPEDAERVKQLLGQKNVLADGN